MKPYILFLVASVCFGNVSNAQSILQRVKDRAVNNANNKVDQKVDNTVDSSFNKTNNAINGIFKKKDKTKKNTTSTDNATAPYSTQTSGNSQVNSGSETGASYQIKSFLDFVPGAIAIFEDDFTRDAMGDFPAKWNTNGSGKIVTIGGQQGKWLQVVHNSIINPVMDKALPENCTIQFDLFLQTDGQRSTPFIQFGITNVKDILKEDIFYKDRFFMNINRYSEADGKAVEYGLKNDVVGNKSDFPLTNYVNKILHVAMALNKTRIRIYLDEQKIIDLPRALTPQMRTNFFLNNNYVVPASELGMLVSNVRIASADVDARSLLIKQLMDEGKAVTDDILFNVNSDVILPQSYEIVNQFGDALKNYPSLKIKITGHTDSDGKAADNLTLSKKRAASVKKYLVINYSIADGRILTDGKGATQPVADNTTADGKGHNRRVEFTKL